ncbi:hypothetical protein VKT23_015986 [Stygiomarasmius scandens]|uniref:Uncharacterized protein n=1 Tax=Marasmiellus scandens TaxID=2682957 RepID=A0ABR1IWA6_9AGAR
MDYSVLYASAKQGWAQAEPPVSTTTSESGVELAKGSNGTYDSVTFARSLWYSRPNASL